MKKLLLILTFGLLLSFSNTIYAGFPERDITNVVVWSAGGGTDTCNRIVSAEMAKILGVRVNVTNKTGGASGSIGMSHVYKQPANGYTIVGLSESVVNAAVQGGWDQKMDVWDPMIIAGSPDVISVTSNAPYNSLADLVADAKKNPKKIRAAASGAGSIHHLNLLALEKGAGIEFNYIPYTGSAPSQTAAMTGEVTVVVTSVAEQQQLIRAGKLKPLAMLTPDAFDLAGKMIPSSFTSFPALSEHLPISQAIGMAVHRDTPQDVKEVLFDAFKKALETDKVKKWAKDSFYTLSGKIGDEAKAEFSKLESLFAWALYDLGAAKHSPEKFGIARL